MPATATRLHFVLSIPFPGCVSTLKMTLPETCCLMLQSRCRSACSNHCKYTQNRVKIAPIPCLYLQKDLPKSGMAISPCRDITIPESPTTRVLYFVSVFEVQRICSRRFARVYIYSDDFYVLSAG